MTDGLALQRYVVHHTGKCSIALEIFAADPRAAALSFTRSYDAFDYGICDGRSLTVVVRDAVGQEQRFVVRGELVPSYQADLMEVTHGR